MAESEEKAGEVGSAQVMISSAVDLTAMKRGNRIWRPSTAELLNEEDDGAEIEPGSDTGNRSLLLAAHAFAKEQALDGIDLTDLDATWLSPSVVLGLAPLCTRLESLSLNAGQQLHACDIAPCLIASLGFQSLKVVSLTMEADTIDGLLVSWLSCFLVVVAAAAAAAAAMLFVCLFVFLSFF